MAFEISESDVTTKKEAIQSADKICDACPNCGWKLSPWQRILLGVDRALICKNCWFRIILDITETPHPPAREAD